MFSVGDVVWIEDLNNCGVILRVFTGDAGAAYVCQTDDGGVEDFAAVPEEQASPWCGAKLGEGE